MSKDVLLSTDHLYATHPGRPMVLADVNVSFRAGVRVAILGANGSGKTTLLRCLSGSLKPVKGGVKRGNTVLGYGRAQLREHRRAVQLVLQDPDDQLFSADVSQDVSFGPMNMGLDVEEVRDRVAEALQLLGASHLAERATHQLSYGERKRIAVAGAVAMRPDLLLLDEPSAGLDPVGVTTMLEALDRLRDHGTTVAMATHDVDLALAWADEALIVVDGGVQQGPIDELLANAAVVERAHLHLPWPLELTRRLGMDERPRTMSEVVAILSHRLPRSEPYGSAG
ncbi:energy-coupling factor ABC transporter ATP-binding protein [Cutibacterium sp.]|uniref:energy-coupling factor ABC transporter ATP-binding protein n=1 Tax=Cutibacterium sp. TaxID=1912221 RepID=UPI0026DC1994|nr:ATP-binding cassette domain-containing protein [Cutibacterium sp.]MDO4412888.1 ATP-binding cassette domain-containing protein [Cutibacterium sp.]